MTVEQRRNEPSDLFPLGMRVLAVDDDPICLRLLETLLRKCQYHVTTTNQAIKALEMLRENKDNFDLVISDVHMPDMDGFKLLELVGLEMDLPVIMLSANSDTKLVLKGITHGACDYLLKPVRMEEIKNIWQHVVRRKKFDSRDSGSNSQDKNSDERNGSGLANSYSDAKLSKKRKDQNVDEDDDEHKENEHENENEDPATQKRPRVVWSAELHRKFVAAVNQLGLDKAVPKKILELMNDEKLTRENVASHLQKYRLYLKRISFIANQQANLAAAIGRPDSSYVYLKSMNFHNFNGSSQFQNKALRSISPAGVLGRLNSPAGLGLHGLPPSSMVQLGHGQIPRSSITENTKFRPGLLPHNQSGNVLQGMPTSSETEKLQRNKYTNGVEKLCPTNDNSRLFCVSSNFPDVKNTIISGTSNSLLGLSNRSLTMQGHSLERQSHETFGINSNSPCDLLEHNSSWPSTVLSQPTPVNSLKKLIHDISINVSAQSQLDSRLNTHCPSGLMGVNMAQNMSYAPKQVWDDHELDIFNHADFLDGPANSSMAIEGAYPCAQVADAKSTNSVLHRHTNFDSIAQPGIDSIDTKHNQMFEHSEVATTMKLKQGQLMELETPYGNYASDGTGSLEDILSAFFKQDQDENNEGWGFAV